MPKYRKLYTKALESLDINDMPDDFTRLFWVLLPLVCDREGRGLDNSFWLKSRVFPLRSDVMPMTIDHAMDWFCRRGMVERYQVEGRSYFRLPTFSEYQGDTSKEAESSYPPPPNFVPTYSEPTPDLLFPKSASDAAADPDPTTDAPVDTEATAEAEPMPVAAAAAPVTDLVSALLALNPPMNEPQAKTLVAAYEPAVLQGCIDTIRARNGVRNPAGLLWKMHQAGQMFTLIDKHITGPPAPCPTCQAQPCRCEGASF